MFSFFARHHRPAAALLALAAIAPSAHACLACGCTLNADWASQGIQTQPGWSVDLRHDFLDQDELRSGLHVVDRGTIALPPDEEIQQRTVNRLTNLTLDRGIGEDWGVTVQVPWIDRYHTTIAEGDTADSGLAFSEIGDARILGRYLGFSRAADWGLQFGLKLPTGATDKAFTSGPQTGETLDRGLQPGTGSTDLLLGAFRFDTLGDPHTSSWEWFGNAMFQLPVAHSSGFRPGNSATLTGGLRYMGWRDLAPQVQLNARFEGRESGTESDAPNSGATLLHLSPGLAWSITPKASIYAFAQVPLYQRVNGLQLEPRWTLSVGAHMAF